MTEPLKELIELIDKDGGSLAGAVERVIPLCGWKYSIPASMVDDPARKDALAMRENYFELLKDYISRPEALRTFRSWNTTVSADDQPIAIHRFSLPHRVLSVDDFVVAMARECLRDEYYYWLYGDDQCRD